MQATSNSPPSSRLWPRIVLAGPLAFITAGLIMGGGALWLPEGAEHIDNLVLPIVLFPAIWALVFFYACLDRRIGRAYWVVLIAALVNAALIARHLIRS
ncbi:MAG: hypothetical protein JWQ90_2646 [Hydrocarboniphaga sp.]|uniref:hypothetical protein n=1 Tax=Hydrocarboniphaga sp. TaxID=2033016 RepID=UPI002623BFBC|nr:hypothetical protein [Hydrocarboniphaga sp.]MDB5970196.1 hypothetical protein [Hydrocarboniphaga sp.]